MTDICFSVIIQMIRKTNRDFELKQVDLKMNQIEEQ